MRKLIAIAAITLCVIVVMVLPLTASTKSPPMKLTWYHSDTLIVGPDTVYSWPIQVDGRGTFTLWVKWYSNQTCSVSVYCEIGLYADTGAAWITLDSVFIGPDESPGDSTMFSSWTLPTKPRWNARQNWLEPAPFMRIKIDTRNNGVNDSLLFLRQAWIFWG